MASSSRVILLEFNELTLPLIDRFVSDGALPNFRRFRDESHTFVTNAGETPPNLEPWIQWVTVHTGMPFSEHGVFNLDEGHLLPASRLWDVVSAAGGQAWVCGSMNVNHQSDFRGALVPDPWCTKVPPLPDAFTPYFKFVQQQVTEYSHDGSSLSPADYARFLAFLAAHGLSAGSSAEVLKQLWSERGNPGERWRRAVLLDKLQFDVFRAYYNRLTPDFSTFFLNSTAHFQHSYWLEMEPDLFKAAAPDSQGPDYSSAILFGYQQMDRLLGKLLDLAGPDVTLMLCTALSQQPCLSYEESGGAVFYRPKDVQAVVQAAALRGLQSVAPVMTHQFQLEFDSEANALHAEEVLSSARVAERKGMYTRRKERRLFTGCDIYSEVKPGAMIAFGGRAVAPFFDLFYKMDAVKSGMHHPDGILWVRTPARTHTQTSTQLPLTAVAPSILDFMRLPRPPQMKAKPVPLAS